MYLSLKELFIFFEDESDMTHLNVVNSWLDHQIELSKDSQFKKKHNDNNKFVSVNLPTNAKSNTYGTKCI